MTESVFSQSMVEKQHGVRLSDVARAYFQHLENNPQTVSGVYVIHETSRVLYVGKSADVHTRVFQSVKERIRFNAWLDFELIYTQSEAAALVLEQALIHHLEPTENLGRGSGAIDAAVVRFLMAELVTHSVHFQAGVKRLNAQEWRVSRDASSQERLAAHMSRIDKLESDHPDVFHLFMTLEQSVFERFAEIRGFVVKERYKAWFHEVCKAGGYTPSQLIEIVQMLKGIGWPEICELRDTYRHSRVTEQFEQRYGPAGCEHVNQQIEGWLTADGTGEDSDVEF